MFQIHTECIYNCKAGLFVIKIEMGKKKSENRDSFFFSILHSPNVCVCVYIYIYIHTHTHTHMRERDD